MLARASGSDFCALVDLVHRDRRTFDSLWYLTFPSRSVSRSSEDGDPGGCDVDAILGGAC